MKFAIYHEPSGGWMVDTGVGGTWSWNVDDAEWFDDPDTAIEMLYACDIVERGIDCRTIGYTFPRVR